MQVASEGLQEVKGCGQAEETVFTAESPKQAEEPRRLLSLGSGLGDAFGNGLENTLEPLRLDAAKDLPPEEQISNCSNGLGRFDIVDYLLQNLVACRQSAARYLQRATISEQLTNLVRGQYGFRACVEILHS